MKMQWLVYAGCYTVHGNLLKIFCIFLVHGDLKAKTYLHHRHFAMQLGRRNHNILCLFYTILPRCVLPQMRVCVCVYFALTFLCFCSLVCSYVFISNFKFSFFNSYKLSTWKFWFPLHIFMAIYKVDDIFRKRKYNTHDNFLILWSMGSLKTS